MRLTARSGYAILALFHLASDGANRPVRSRAIAEQQNIPHRFLEQILLNLKKAGLVRSFRGARGGYQLAVAPREVTLKDAIEAVEGSIYLLGSPESRGMESEGERRLLRTVWAGIEESFIKSLGSITLEDLKNRQQAERNAPRYGV
ncbi:MAG: Rrf2 family transcriptional regulator [Acidobacteria bacterium]|nr:Rrf2 family transcriptional regulator [Acidobacteriota bacterium]